MKKSLFLVAFFVWWYSEEVQSLGNLRAGE